MTNYKAIIEIYSIDKGGRPCMPEGSGYSPLACSVGGEEYLPIVLHNVPSAATLDTAFEASIEFLYPERLDYLILSSGLEFDLVEGVKRIGKARVQV
ncbi:hypothetical protein [Pseudoalteromonas luteoviolacea]|uniref:Uncharacterized protein n=1 Tax=Pseudoalteromonas luteoviolacea NCIMB 1942 TaxID=1365253 RepID=A0A167HC82_9GAMM|nr:hypothetical protein [Pseudoalteromonas luteoviolacea]KZN57962.1 hypothetical protein N482_22945 [Pseudoalteromonas luteoviolacea NCIMB 1942]